MGLENRVLNFGGAQEKWRRGSGPDPKYKCAWRGHARGKMEEGTQAKPHTRVCSARPPQEKMEEGTEATGGEGQARPSQEKWRKGPRSWPNRGKDQRGHPGKKGGGDRGQSPTRGGPGEATPGQMGGAVAEAIAQRGVRAGRGHPREKRRMGQRPNSNAGTSWRNHPRQKWRRKPGQAQRKGWDTTGTPAEEEERQNAKGPAQVSRAVLEEEGPPKMAAWAMGITPQPNPAFP